MKKRRKLLPILRKNLLITKRIIKLAKDKVVELEAKYDELVSKTSELNNGEYVVIPLRMQKQPLKPHKPTKKNSEEIINKAKATIDDLKVAMEEAQKQ